MVTGTSKKSFFHTLRNKLWPAKDSLMVEQDDDLITLISVAQEDPLIRNQLLSILRQPEFQRQSIVNTWLEDLKLTGAPLELQNGLSALLDEKVADQALDLLNQTE